MGQINQAFFILIWIVLVSMELGYAQPRIQMEKIPTNTSVYVRVLIKKLYSSDAVTRGKAAYELGIERSSPAVPFLINMLHDEADLEWSGIHAYPSSISTSPAEEAMKALVSIGKPAVKPLVDALKDRNREIRERAARALVTIEDPRAVMPLIVALLRDKDKEIRRYAAGVLGGIKDPRAVEPLIASLTKDTYPYARASAAGALGVIKDPRAVEPLIIALAKDKNPDVRATAARALGKIRDPRAIEPLIAALEDNWQHIITGAIDALGKFKDPRVVEPLIAALKARHKEAASVLGKIKDPRAVEPLMIALLDKGRSMGGYAASALEEMGQHAVEPLIAAIKENKEGRGRDLAIGVLVKIGLPAVDALIVTLQDEHDDVRRYSAGVLGGIKDPRAVEPLIASLTKDTYPYARASAAEALGVIKDPRAVEPLIIALAKDMDPKVRASAVWALGKFKDPRIVELLIAALKDEHWSVKVNAVSMLGKIKDPRAIEPLISTLEDKYGDLQQRAAEALRRITGKDFGKDSARWHKWWAQSKSLTQ